MNNIIFSFLLTTIAGFSTMIGSLFIFLKKFNYKKVIAYSLAFASGVMITISVTDLSYESFMLLNKNFNSIYTIIICFIFIILGIIISMVLDKILPKYGNEDKSLYKIGLITMIAIIIHNIPEGIATFIASNNNINLGISMTIAIALHNIPEGISIAIPIYFATKSKKKAFFYTLISACSEPFGAILTYLFLLKYINDTILGILFALICGIMLQISFCELLPTSKKYKQKHTYIFLILGILFMLVKFFI